MKTLNRKLGTEFLSHLQSALDSSPTCIIIAEAPSGKIIYINSAVVDFRGGKDKQHIGLKIEEYVKTWKEYSSSGKLLNNEEMPLSRAILHGEIVDREEIIVELDDGSKKWALASASPIHDSNGNIIAGSVFWYDISKQKRIEEKLQQIADHDTLTDVYSRKKIFDLADRAFERVKKEKSSIVCLMLDIDHFKAINDSYGHTAGDEALSVFAETVSGCVRSADLIGRVGGEEFLLVLPGASYEAGNRVAENIRSKVEETTIKLKGQRLSLTVSIGLAVFDSDRHLENLDELIEIADNALYAAKRSGRNRVCTGNS